MGKNILNSVFEFVFCFSKENAKRTIGTIEFRGTLDNILHLKSQHKNEYAKEHNATYPIEFCSWFIQNFADKTVLDLFGGTGTTLIACEQLGKQCYMMELDERYCDIIVATKTMLYSVKVSTQEFDSCNIGSIPIRAVHNILIID